MNAPTEHLYLDEKTYAELIASVTNVLRTMGASTDDIYDETHIAIEKLAPQWNSLLNSENTDELFRAVVKRASWSWIDSFRYSDRILEPFDQENIDDVIDCSEVESLLWTYGDREEFTINSPEELIIKEETECEKANLLRNALALLNDNERQVVFLHFYEFYNIKKIAKMLLGSDDKKAQNWVSQVKRRAMQRLHKHLES